MNKQPSSHRLKRPRLSVYGCLGTLLIGLGSSHAAALPEQFSATYDVKKSGVTIGETQRTLQREGDAYLFESITRPVGIAKLFTSGQVIERSHWAYFQGQPRPLQYTLFNSGGKKDRRVQLDFDWEKNRVINTVDNQPWTMPLEHDTSDKLLYQLRIMQDLSTTATTATTLRYPVADGGKLKYYDIEILGQERIKTALGTFDTVRLRYIKGSRKTTMWCARELAYLPVRIEQRKDDDSPVIAVLTSVRGL
ncbi:MAG: DUF3108 domain-containing protein [Gammaproteobacteria bacterium]|nr:DUF3108 domain-containing protein [Gammaproteobacteria bacterium]